MTYRICIKLLVLLIVRLIVKYEAYSESKYRLANLLKMRMNFLKFYFYQILYNTTNFCKYEYNYNTKCKINSYIRGARFCIPSLQSRAACARVANHRGRPLLASSCTFSVSSLNCLTHFLIIPSLIAFLPYISHFVLFTKLTMNVSLFHISCIGKTDNRPYFTVGGQLDCLKHVKCTEQIRKHDLMLS